MEEEKVLDGMHDDALSELEVEELTALQTCSMQIFFHAGLKLIHIGYVNPTESRRRYKNVFGVTDTVTAALWKELIPKVDEETPPAHLLWALMFLRGYDTEYVTEVLTGVSRKTHRQHCWKMVAALADLRLVRTTRKPPWFHISAIDMVT